MLISRPACALTVMLCVAILRIILNKIVHKIIMPTTIIWFLNLINSSCPCASAAFAAASIANLLKTDKPVPISARIIFAILKIIILKLCFLALAFIHTRLSLSFII